MTKTQKQARLRTLIKKTGLSQRSFALGVAKVAHSTIKGYLTDQRNYWFIEIADDRLAELEKKSAEYVEAKRGAEK